MGILKSAIENDEFKIIDAILGSLYCVIGYSETAREQLKMIILETAIPMLAKEPEKLCELFRICTFYIKDFKSIDSLLEKSFISSMLKCVSKTTGDIQEHILTCIYELCSCEKYQKLLREIPWEDSLHHLVPIYPKFREPISYIFVTLQNVFFRVR